MSELNDMKLKIEAKIHADGLDEKEVKGKIGLKCGKLMAFINASTADDPQTVSKLRLAAKEILNMTL